MCWCAHYSGSFYVQHSLQVAAVAGACIYIYIYMCLYSRLSVFSHSCAGALSLNSLYYFLFNSYLFFKALGLLVPCHESFMLPFSCFRVVTGYVISSWSAHLHSSCRGQWPYIMGNFQHHEFLSVVVTGFVRSNFRYAKMSQNFNPYQQLHIQWNLNWPGVEKTHSEVT